MKEKLARKILWPLLFLLFLSVILLSTLGGDTLISRALFNLREIMAEGGDLRETILSYGYLAPLLFMLLQILQVVFAPLPGEATGFLGGYLFGIWPGFLLSSVALTLGSGAAFAVGRLFGEAFRQYFRKTVFYSRFNHLVYKGDFVIPFILMLIPGFPKDALSYLLGLSAMPFGVFIWIALLARMPGTMILCIEGAHVYQQDYFRFFLVVLAYGGVTLPCYLFRKPLLRHLARYNKTREQNGLSRRSPDPDHRLS